MGLYFEVKLFYKTKTEKKFGKMALPNLKVYLKSQ